MVLSFSLFTHFDVNNLKSSSLFSFTRKKLRQFQVAGVELATRMQVPAPLSSLAKDLMLFFQYTSNTTSSRLIDVHRVFETK